MKIEKALLCKNPRKIETHQMVTQRLEQKKNRNILEEK